MTPFRGQKVKDQEFPKILLPRSGELALKIHVGRLKKTKTKINHCYCLHGQAPLYLTELCRPISSDDGHRHLRSAFTRRLIVPRTKTSYGDRSFSVHGPSVWNSLPNDLRLSDMSLETFTSRLKAFLFWTLIIRQPIC